MSPDLRAALSILIDEAIAAERGIRIHGEEKTGRAEALPVASERMF